MTRQDVKEDIERLAIQIFANEEKALHWLNKPMKKLDWKSPMQVVEQENKPELIEDLLHALDHGYLQ